MTNKNIVPGSEYHYPEKDKTWVLFSVQSQYVDHLRQALDNPNYSVNYKECNGSYEGFAELSWLVSHQDWVFLKRLSDGQNFGWFDSEESILVLGPADEDKARPATLQYLDANRPLAFIGKFVQTCEKTAKQGIAWTQDIETGSYYHCVPN